MTTWAVALAGGGMKGAYHLGAWRAIQKLELPVGAIAGTSIGSVNGALFVQGDAELAEAFWRQITPEQIVELPEKLSETENLLDVRNLIPMLSEIAEKNGLKTEPFRKLLTSVIDEEKIRNAPVSFGLTTTEMSQMKGLELFCEDIPQGMLVEYIMASSCFPGFRKPKLDGIYADGGIVNNLPADMLIRRGYRNILAIDIGGMGLVQKRERLGCNVVNVRCSENLIGTFEFKPEQIEKTIRLGYLDTLKTFGKLVGERYFFNISDYAKSRAFYAQEILSGMELAAEAFGIDRLKVYRVEDLIDGVKKGYQQWARLETPPAVKLVGKDAGMIVKLVGMILEENTEYLSNKLFGGMLGENLIAANAIAYFLRY